MEQTGKYGLSQWDAEDRILMEDFNADNAKIEAAIKDLETSTAQALAKAGNCKIVTGSYKGTGGYGSGNRNTLTFDGTPIVVIVAGSRGFTALRGATGTSCLGAEGGEPFALYLTWGTNSLSWYANNNAYSQCNTTNETYHYCALFATA